MRRLLLLCTLAWSTTTLASNTALPTSDLAGSRDLPWLERYEGSLIVAYSQKAYDEYTVARGPLERTPNPEDRDERNNRRQFPITLADDLPFVVDFSLLPNNTVVETPFRLGSDDFFPWNLDFTVGSLADAGCIDTPLDLVDQDADDVVLTLGAEAAPACVTQPLNITIIRQPIADVQLEIIPTQAGVVTLRLYSNPSGGEPIFVNAPQAVNAGEQVTLGTFDGQPRLIRRIEISLDNQPVRLTQLTLLPVLQSP